MNVDGRNEQAVMNHAGNCYCRLNGVMQTIIK